MLSNSEQIKAIAWKAQKLGISYGTLSASLADGEKEQIYDEYEAYWTAKSTKYVSPKSKKKGSDNK